MYNCHIKERFIEDRYNGMKTQREAATLFGLTERWESKWDLDLCALNVEQLQNVIDNVLSRKARSHSTRLNILKEYIKWALQNNIEGACRSIDEIKEVGLTKVKQQLVANPFHLQHILDTVFEEEKLQTHDNVYRVYLWCGYSGLKEEEVMSLTKENIDLTSLSIRINGKKYPIYREALTSFRICAENDFFEYVHPNYSRTIKKERFSGNFLLRGLTHSSSDVIYIRREIARRMNVAFKNNAISSKPSYQRMISSGIFYRKYEQEIAGLPIDFLEEAKIYTEGKTYDTKSDQHTMSHIIKKIATNYYNDYIRWKSAFYD